jgi:CheY-like chemotaxis protein
MTTTQASVLVVDDNPENLDMLSRRLARHGYTVAVAEDGEQALSETTAHLNRQPEYRYLRNCLWKITK